MKNFLFYFFVAFLISSNVLAKTLEQKKEELKKIYQSGGISKIEYKKALQFLENSDEKIQKNSKKKIFSIKDKQKKKNQTFSGLPKKDKEEITLEKIDKLGEPTKLDNSYFSKSMMKKFKGCNSGFKCKGDKAGQILFKTFNRNKSFGQKNPGQMIKAMAMYEVFYASTLWSARNSIKRYKENNYNELISRKKADEKKIRSLFGINKGKIAMREALGMNADTSTKEAIKKFWLLGEFLDLGKGVDKEKIDKDLKRRQKLLEDYKTQIANLKNKLEDELESEEEIETNE